ncbi:GNAT family N-acetyltransferase [Marinobacterium jannaschii]|uniref:GNAT family N-acetyltransferase n=1 Tax=Marinobacterium jannaschii TaxID=64970 RepID=UPI0004814CF5|nr:GNAT family N-acetyltransferase [Marinobacterium jannaschii]
MAIQLMSPQAADREQWQQLYCGYAGFYQVPMDQQILDRVWGWIFDPQTPFYALIAKDDSGRVLGLMHYRAMPSPLRGAEVGFLDDLFVHPDVRGRGVVDALFDALQSAAAEKGWPFVRWITAEDNHRAQAVYAKVADKTQWQTWQMAVD